jgi:hypothetical protein
MKQKHMAPERNELGEILRFQESLLRLVANNRTEQHEPAAPGRPAAAEKIAEMARKVAQAS